MLCAKLDACWMPWHARLQDHCVVWFETVATPFTLLRLGLCLEEGLALFDLHAVNSACQSDIFRFARSRLGVLLLFTLFFATGSAVSFRRDHGVEITILAGFRASDVCDGDASPTAKRHYAIESHRTWLVALGIAAWITLVGPGVEHMQMVAAPLLAWWMQSKATRHSTCKSAIEAQELAVDNIHGHLAPAAILSLARGSACATVVNSADGTAHGSLRALITLLVGLCREHDNTRFGLAHFPKKAKEMRCDACLVPFMIRGLFFLNTISINAIRIINRSWPVKYATCFVPRVPVVVFRARLLLPVFGPSYTETWPCSIPVPCQTRRAHHGTVPYFQC